MESKSFEVDPPLTISPLVSITWKFGSFSKMLTGEPNRSGIEPSAVILNGFVPYVLQFISQELHFVSQEATLCLSGSRAKFEL